MVIDYNCLGMINPSCSQKITFTNCVLQGLRSKFKLRGTNFSNSYKSVSNLSEVLKLRPSSKIKGCNGTHGTPLK